MRHTRLLAVALALGMTAAGCDDDDPTGPSISQFAGTWTASSIRYTSISTPSRTLEAVSAAGAALTLTLNSTGTITAGTFRQAAAATPVTLTGTVTLVAGTTNQADVDLTWPTGVTPQIADFRATYTLAGNNLTFSRNDATFQFPGQSAAETSSLVIIMSRT